MSSEAANEAVTKGGKLELLVVAAQQIAAGTAQLVVSSRVKADRKSGNLSLLSQASRGVSTATGAVVAAAKACRNMVETAGKYFFICWSAQLINIKWNHETKKIIVN